MCVCACLVLLVDSVRFAASMNSMLLFVLLLMSMYCHNKKFLQKSWFVCHFLIERMSGFCF